MYVKVIDCIVMNFSNDFLVCVNTAVNGSKQLDLSIVLCV